MNVSEAYKQKVAEQKIKDNIKQVFGDCSHAGKIPTPLALCGEIISHLPDLNDKDVLILFNPEFYCEVLRKYPQAKITFVSGSENAYLVQEVNGFRGMQEVIHVDPYNFEQFEENMKGKKFDCIISNPPYQANKDLGEAKKKKGTIGGDLWSKFVPKCVELCKDNGHIAMIHPPMWRKPEHKIWELLKNFQMKILSIHSEEDGRRTFKAGTKYDWYVVQKKPSKDATTVIDEERNVHKINLKDFDFLPNYNFEKFNSLLAKSGEERCEVLYDASSHTQRKNLISKEQTEEFKYPCIHGLQKDNGVSIWYSSDNTKGFFGVPKVILTWGRHQYPMIDMDGKYGMTQVVFGLKVDSQEEAEGIKKAIESDEFKKILACSKWASFQTEWRMFKSFKKDFWKELV